MKDYNLIIKAKYPAARGPFEPGQNYEIVFRYDDETSQHVPEFRLWLLLDPQPTFAELDAYAASPEYLAAWGARLKAGAEAEVNAWANRKVMAYKILEPELFYTAMVSNIAFTLLEWNNSGRPTEPDPTRFITTYAEAQAYREAHAGQGDFEETITVQQLLMLQETRWTQMQNGFAAIVFTRRLALEKIKLATVDETLPDALAAILAALA